MNESNKPKYTHITPKKIANLIEKNQFSFLSGPVSFTSFDDNGKKYYFFGDEHFDKVGNCETKYKNVKIPCLTTKDKNSKHQVCYDFVYFLEKLFKNNEYSGEYLDFYMETPFKRKYMRKTKSDESDYISSIEKVFKNCFEREKSKCKYKKTRFHYIDFRIKDPKNIASINYIPVRFVYIIKKELEKKDISKDKLIDKIKFYDVLTKRLFQKNINQKLLDAHFKDNFIQTIENIYKTLTRGLKQRKYKIYLSRVRKIFNEAKKYYKVREGKKVHIIKSQLDALRKEGVKHKNQEMGALIEKFVKQNYQNKIDIESIQQLWREYIDGLLMKINSKENKEQKEYNSQIEEFLVGSAIEMDAHIFDVYLLGRMFRNFKYSKREEHIPSQTIVTYAGNYHIRNYISFFIDVLGMKPEVSVGAINSTLKRCVYSPELKKDFTL